jgi:hypothetical protein
VGRVGVGDHHVLGDTEGAVRAERDSALLRPLLGGGVAGNLASGLVDDDGRGDDRGEQSRVGLGVEQEPFDLG